MANIQKMRSQRMGIGTYMIPARAVVQRPSAHQRFGGRALAGAGLQPRLQQPFEQLHWAVDRARALPESPA